MSCAIGGIVASAMVFPAWIYPPASQAAGAEHLGEITDQALAEISGLVWSRRHADVLWAINDSGNPAELHALSPNGQRLASVPVAGVRNRDWEDLAAVTLRGEQHLLIADIGDNRAVRPYVTVWLVREPDLDPLPDRLEPTQAIHFTYPNGPRDAEGLAVDPDRGRVLVLSKRTTPPELYALPLTAASASTADRIVATFLGHLEGIPEPTAIDFAADPAMGAYSAQPTALDYRADVGLVVLTYARPYLYPIPAGEHDFADLLAGPPSAMLMPRLRQAEALALRGGRVLVTSEHVPAPVIGVQLPASAASTAAPAPGTAAAGSGGRARD